MLLTNKELHFARPDGGIYRSGRMASESQTETPRWFVLNHIGPAFQDMARKAVDRFNTACRSGLELFAPTYVVREERNGEVRMRTVSLTFHYVFVRGTLPEVKDLCSQSNGFSFLIDHGNPGRRYATVSDRDMDGFRTVARAYRNCLPYFPLDGIDLEEGDLVEVVNGDFPGLVGTYMPRAGSNAGNIVLNVYNNVGTIAFNVRATDVRVLEFSRKSTRANDQIDAFVPHLLQALRHYHDDTPLPAGLIARLTVFRSRMGVVRLNNSKVDARLQALLYAAGTILGDTEAASVAQNRLDTLLPTVTNEWTRALITLIVSVLTDDRATLTATCSRLATISPTSRAQHALLAEYTHYTAKVVAE